jgi:Uma2 family endonuclease
MARPAADGDRRLSAAEFERLPEPDAWRSELVRGRLVREPRPGARHGSLAARLVHLLYGFVEAGGHGVVLADAGVLLSRDPDTVRGPDIAFFSPDRVPASGYETPFWGAPDLAVEIASPSNRPAELQEKVADYIGAGVRRVWVVDPRTRSVTVHRPDGSARLLKVDDVLEGEDVLPGFALRLDRLFAL